MSLTHAVLALIWGVSLTYPVLASSFIWRLFLTHPVLVSFFTGGISLTYPVHAGFVFIWEASQHGMCDFLLHIPCWLHFYLGSFSYTSSAGFIFIWGVLLTYPIVDLFLCGVFLLHIFC